MHAQDVIMKKYIKNGFLHGLSLFVLVWSIAATASVSVAAPAPVMTQVPGYYRMKLADFEITALYDGSTAIGANLLKGISEKDIQSLLARMFIEKTDGVQTAVNAYLVNSGEELVLVDTGAGKCFGPGLGIIGDNIRAAGYQPEQITTVLLTHLHGDHACGLRNDNGEKAFPNARVLVSKAEADFWLSEAVAAKAPKEAQPFFQMSRESVAPYVAEGMFETYDASDESILPRMEVIPLAGHTPGHTGYLFRSQGKSLLVWGDIIHNHAVQFPRPEVTIEFDVDGAQAAASRKRILARAAEEKLWIAGAHLPFPGLGHVRAEGEGKGYSWVPVEYGPVR